MKKTNKPNRKSRTSSASHSQKLFRNGSQGFEALEPRQMLDAGLANALFDTAIPYTVDADNASTTVLTVKPSSDTANDGTDIYAGIRIYGISPDGNGYGADNLQSTTSGFSISKIEKVNADGSKTAISLIDPGCDLQSSYSFACANLVLGQEYSITVSWNGTAGTAPKFGAIAYLIGDTDAFTTPDDNLNAMPAFASGNYTANTQSNISTNEVNLVKASLLLDDPMTDWNHGTAADLLASTGFSDQYVYHFATDTNGSWASTDLARVQQNAKAGNVNFNMTFDQEAPALSVSVTDSSNNEAGSSVVTPGEVVDKTEYYTVNIDTSNAGPTITLNFTDNKSAIKSIGLSTDNTDGNYNNSFWTGIDGDSKTETVTITDVTFTEDGSADRYVKVTDVIGNTAVYHLVITYKSTTEFLVTGDANSQISDDSGNFSSKVITNNTGDRTLVIDPAFAAPTEGQSTETSQRVGVTYKGTTYYSDFQKFTYSEGAWNSIELKLSDFNGLLAAMGASSAESPVIPDNTFNFDVVVQDTFAHDAQSVGSVILTVDTAAPDFTITLDGDAIDDGREIFIADKTDDKSAIVVTLDAADATKVTVAIAEDNTADITAGSTTANLTLTNVYGKKIYTLTATDEAGNVSTLSFTVYYNTSPTAADITVNIPERQTQDSALTATDYKEINFADYIDDNGQTADADCTITITASDIDTYGSLYTKSGDTYTKVAAVNGEYSFAGDAVVYFLPKLYLNTTETIFSYTVSDNDITNGKKTQTGEIHLTIAAVDTAPAVTWTNPRAFDEDATDIPTDAASGVVIGQFAYNATEAGTRTWSCSAVVVSNTNGVHQLNDGSDTISQNLIASMTSGNFAVVDSGTTDAYGNTIFNVVMFNWGQNANLWGTQGFSVAVTSGTITSNTGTLTYTVNSVNDAPIAGTQKQFNVSLSGLAKNDVVLTFDNTMFSDVDNTYAQLSISQAVLTIGDNSITLTTAAPTASLTINGIDTEFTLTGKTIVISANTAEALDKAVVDIVYTVSDGQASTEISGATIKFSAYASDDSVTMDEDAAETGFNVLDNDRGTLVDGSTTEYTNWGEKTFTITAVGDDTTLAVEDTFDITGGRLTIVSLSDVTGNNFTFKPTADWNGTTTFTYTITNSADPTETATATVTITVNPVNDYPTFEWNTDAGLTIDGNTASFAVDEDADKIDEGEAGAFSGTIILGTYTDIDSAVAALNAALAADGNISIVQSGKISASDTVGDLFSNWSLSVNASFQLVFTCALKDFAYGSATIKFTPTDEATAGSQGTTPVEHTFTLTVNPINDTPEANNATLTVLEDADYTPISLTFGENSDIYDIESPKANLSFKFQAPTNGTLYNRTGDGTVESPYVFTAITITDGWTDWLTKTTYMFYKPNANYSGTETVQYQIKDSGVDAGLTAAEDAVSELANFTITVTAVNDAPVLTWDTTNAPDGAFTVDEDSAAKTDWVIGAVTDVDGDTVSVANLVVTDTKGVLKSYELAVKNGNLVISYELNENANGEVSFAFKLSDGREAEEHQQGTYEDYTLTMTVDAVNDAPTATDATWNISIGALEKVVSGTESTFVKFDFSGYINDVEGDALQFNTVGESTTYTVYKNGTEITDGSITAVDAYNAEAGTGTLTVTFAGEPAKTVVFNLAYTATGIAITGVTGDTALLDKVSLVCEYYVQETETAEKLESDPAAFTIKFSAYTQDDSATYDEVTTEGGATHIIDVLDNDNPNWDGKTFTITAINGTAVTAGATSITVAGGTVLLNADGTITYNQTTDYRGTFTFTYTITEVVEDGVTPETADGTVTVVVNAVNHAPTAAQVNAAMDESQDGTGKVLLNFADAVADRETADADLTITVANLGLGTLVDVNGDELTHSTNPDNGSKTYTFSATDAVYYKPVQYWNGNAILYYTVTDRLEDVPTPRVDGAADKTVQGSVVVVVNAVGTTPSVTATDKSVDEDSTGTSVTVGTASMPTGLESLASVSAVVKGDITAHKLNDGSDSLTALLADGYTFSIDTSTGEITFNYGLLANVYGSQTFTVTVTTAEGGTKSFDWTFTVNSVNDAPTTNGVAEKGTVTDGTGNWSKTTAELKALILAASSDVDDTLTDAMITIQTTGMTGITYDAGTDTYSLTTTSLSDTFTLSYTIDDGHTENNTVDGVISVKFNQAPVINNYSGFQSVDTTSAAQSGAWKLFSLSDVQDPEGKTITADLISLPANAYWGLVSKGQDSNSVYMDYEFTQGTFDHKTAVITLIDPDDSNLVRTVNYTIAATADISIPLNSTETETGQRDIASTDSYYYDVTTGTLTTDSSKTINLKSLFGTDGTFTAKIINIDGAGNVPIYDNSGNQTGTKYVSPLLCSPINGILAATGDDFVTLKVTNGEVAVQVKSYAGEQDRSVVLQLSDGVNTINVNINLTPDSVVSVQYFESVLTEDGEANTKKQYTIDKWFGGSSVDTTLTEAKEFTCAPNESRVFNVYANDSWFMTGMNTADGQVFTIAFEINFQSAVEIDGFDGFSLAELSSDGLTLSCVKIISASNYNTAIAKAEYYTRTGYFIYHYVDSTTTATPIFNLSAVIRSIDGNNQNLNLNSQVDARNAVTGAALYGTESAEQTIVQGTGIYMAVSTGDSAAQTAENLPESETWIHEWQAHYVDLYLNTQVPTVNIDGSVTFTLNYDASTFTATNFIAGDIFDGVAQIKDENGKVFITGFLKQNVSYDDGFVLLGRVKFDSLGTDGLSANTIGSVGLGLSLSKIDLSDTAGNQISVNTKVVANTQLWAVVYDTNDDGIINMADFISFASYFNTNTIVSNDALAWALDFDKSGKVDMSDFVQFAQNFNVTRSNGSVTFAEGFIKQYIGTNLEGEGDASLTELVNKAIGEWETKLGVDLSDVNIQLKVKDYSDAQLGESYIVSLTEDGKPVTGVITLDSNAAGLYWSIDTNNVSEGKYDLYTVILHEVGHLLGYTDQYSAFDKVTESNTGVSGSHSTDSSDLMYETINPGERKDISDTDAEIIKDAYNYAADNGATLTYVGSVDMSAAATGTVSSETAVQQTVPVVATGIVNQEQWTKTLETKVVEELNRIVALTHQNVIDQASDDSDAVLDDFADDGFAVQLAGKTTEQDALFSDLSWISSKNEDTSDDELSIDLEFPFD